MIIFNFKRDAFLRETIVYSPAPSTSIITIIQIVIFLFFLLTFIYMETAITFTTSTQRKTKNYHLLH